MFGCTPSKKNFKAICRLCGEECSELIKLHLRKNRQRNLKQSIKNYLGIKITPTDKLPDKICGPCIAKLDETTDFIKKCTDMQHILQIALEEKLDVEEKKLDQPSDMTIKLEPLEESSVIVDVRPASTTEHQNTSEVECASITIPEHTSDNIYDEGTTEFVDVSLIEDEHPSKNKNVEPPALPNLLPVVVEKKPDRKSKEADPLKKIRASTTNRLVKLSESKKIISFKCPHCDQKLSTRRNLRYHIKRVHLEKMEKCPKCDKILRSRYLWKKHMLIHSAERKFRCDECNKSYLSAPMLRIHKQTHIPIEERYKFNCDLCGKKFTSKSNIKAHMRVHTGVTPFVCDQCGKKYITKGNLQMHYRIHTGEQPYECGVCGKKYANPNPFKVHQRTHTGMKPFACSYCSKTFKSSFVLKRHTNIHTGTRPCPCRYCDKRFIDHGKRKIHERIHTGERPYKCPLCSSAFYESGNLRKHCKNVHYQEFLDGVLNQDPGKRVICSNIASENEQTNISSHHEETETFQDASHSLLDHTIFSNSSLYSKLTELPL